MLTTYPLPYSLKPISSCRAHNYSFLCFRVLHVMLPFCSLSASTKYVAARGAYFTITMFLPAKMSIHSEQSPQATTPHFSGMALKGDTAPLAGVSKPPLVAAPGHCCFDTDANDCSLQAVSWNEKEMSLHVGKVTGHSDPVQL